MKNTIIITALLANLFLLMMSGLAMADDPATSYYTTNGSDPVTRTDDILAVNPPCPEELRVYGEYSKIAADAPCGKPQRRDRIWICNDGTGNQGFDIEYLSAVPCK
ncbi:MAG TPA: hypothetical protein VN642_18675 [Dongiaceae bacterium]|nr:hypothetical protein [Dongiaceae bacterium]